MAAPIWPGTLPQKLQEDGFTYELADNLETAETAAGVTRSNPQFSSVADPFKSTLLLTDAERIALVAFYRTTLVSGALDFDLPDQLDRVGGAPDWRVKFTKPPAFTALGGGQFRASIELVKLP